MGRSACLQTPPTYSRRPRWHTRSHVTQGGRPVTTRVPHPFCNSRATGVMRRKMGAARVAFLKRPCGIPAMITGVIFFTSKRDSVDFRSAPSGIELRPVLAFSCQY